MSTLVVDACVAVKWFLPEVHSEAAARLLEGNDVLIAPDLIWVEAANAVWKRLVRGEITTAEAREIVGGIADTPLLTEPTRGHVEAAFEVAAAAGCTVYDAVYFALAEARDCRMVTADRSLHSKLHEAGLGDRVLWVEE